MKVEAVADSVKIRVEMSLEEAKGLTHSLYAHNVSGEAISLRIMLLGAMENAEKVYPVGR